jgi:Ser/Thr protein kinase RdoA (MazF antagonist)
MENWFEGLSRRAQIGQLQRLAHTAVAAYDITAPRLTLLRHLYNTTFRVDDADGQRYVLRIHRSGTPTVESVGAELAWLSALRRDTPLEVPAPVPTRDGSLLTVAVTPNMPEPHICVLLRWLDGQGLNAGLTPTRLERVGELTARLQEHAKRFGPPPGFPRARVDGLVESARRLPDPFAPEVVAKIQTLVTDTLGAKEAALVAKVIAQVQAAERALSIRQTNWRSPEEHPPTFGLIHADLHHYNLLFARGTVKAIDFDDCGFGPHLYDLAVTLNELVGRATYPVLRAGLLTGYRRVRPLSVEHEAYLDTFIALRQLQDALWVLEQREHPAIGEDWAAEGRQRLVRLQTFLAAGS